MEIVLWFYYTFLTQFPFCFLENTPLTSPITRIFRFIDIILCRYLYSQPVGMKLIDELMDINNLSNKPSPVLCGLSVIILIDEFTNGKSAKKTFTCFILSVLPSLNMSTCHSINDLFSSIGMFVGEFDI